MICQNCKNRAEERDCTNEELKYGLCDTCLEKIKENGVNQYKMEVNKLINEKLLACEPLNYSWTPNGKIPVYDIEDAITIRVLDDLKRELNINTLESIFIENFFIKKNKK